MGRVEIILLIILAILVLFFGAKKLPELARGVGQSAKELKKGFRDGLEDDKDKKSSDNSDKK